MKRAMWILLPVAMLLSSVSLAEVYVIAKETSDRQVSGYLEKKADYLVSELSISNDKRDPIERFQYMEQARKALLSKLSGRVDIEGRLLPVQLNINRHNKVSSLFYDSTIQYRLMTKLNHFQGDFLAASNALRKFVDALPKIDGTEYSLSPVKLAIAGPEKYRQELLEEIKGDIDRIKATLGKNSVIKVSGLERPVIAEQMEEANVAVFINYTIDMEIGKE